MKTCGVKTVILPDDHSAEQKGEYGVKEFGRLLSCNRENNRVQLCFENGKGRIEIVTEKIVRILAELVPGEEQSRAIEGEKAKETSFRIWTEAAGAASGEIFCIGTDALTVRISDGFKADICRPDGSVLCRDYRGKRTPLQRVSEEARALLEAEGHTAREENEESLEVLKQIEGGESFYGLGDKTGFLNKRGYEYLMWNTDDAKPHVDSFRALYKSIPFVITLRDDAVFGLFFDNPRRSTFDLGKESDYYYRYGAAGGNLDYYFIAGNSMPEVVGGYTYLTGCAPLPQKWTLGYQQSRWSYMTEKEVRQVAEKMREYRIPCDVIHLDIDYMDAYKVFTWNPARYDDSEKMIRDLAKDGFRIVTIIDPGVKLEPGYGVYDEGLAKGYFAKTPEGEVYVNEVWPGDAVYPDFGRKEVRNWWADNHRFLLDKGVRGVWNDMNEPASFRGELPENVVFADEEETSDHARMHNLYGHNMARAAYQGLKEMDGRRPFIITRACYAGTQKYATAWTGDNHSIWAHLQMMIPQLCNLGLSGMPFVGTDVGGFGSDCTKELLCRWVEAGCFAPLFRNHSAMGTRRQEPWQFDEETAAIYRKAVELRYHLIPYYYDLFFDGEATGLPILRPLVLHYEKDPAVRNLNGEFLVGEKLLAAPVIAQGETKKLLYLPKGEWYDYYSGERLTGRRWIVRDAPLDTCPLYVKAGTILPVWPRQNYVGELDTDRVLRLEVFPGEGVWEHYQDDGESFAYRNGNYNQYHCSLGADGVLRVSCMHRGYGKQYHAVWADCMGKTVEAEFADGVCEIHI